jgi:hypothetical protein
MAKEGAILPVLGFARAEGKNDERGYGGGLLVELAAHASFGTTLLLLSRATSWPACAHLGANYYAGPVRGFVSQDADLLDTGPKRKYGSELELGGGDARATRAWSGRPLYLPAPLISSPHLCVDLTGSTCFYLHLACTFAT